MVGVSSFSWVE